MSSSNETITIEVIHKCKSCKDVGVRITNDQVVKCCDCDAIEDNHDAKSWFEIKEDGSIGVKAEIHLEQEPGKSWKLKEFN